MMIQFSDGNDKHRRSHWCRTNRFQRALQAVAESAVVVVVVVVVVVDVVIA